MSLIIWNILKDSNYCFDSLEIRIRSKDLKTPYPKNRTTQISIHNIICFTCLASLFGFFSFLPFSDTCNTFGWTAGFWLTEGLAHSTYKICKNYHLLRDHLLVISAFVCVFSWKEICVQKYFSYVKYEDLSATINLST